MNTFEAVRKAVIEVLVPEIRQLGERIDAVRTELGDRIARVEAETTALRGEISGLRKDIANLADKLEYGQRVARLEEQVAFLMRRGG